jgi:hypothetical protein
MGLPKGSIRAVIALSLIVLFSILSIFLYQGVSRGNVVTIAEMSAADRAQFIKDHTNAVDLQSVPTKGKDGFFDVSYRSANPASDDFAKQLLVFLGTLMTAITSFYLGAGVVADLAVGSHPSVAPPAPRDPRIPALQGTERRVPTLRSPAPSSTIARRRSRRRICSMTGCCGCEVDPGFWTGGLGGADAVPF